MRIEYIYHSGFLIETETVVLIFDYYKDDSDKNVGKIVAGTKKRLYFFVSHSHQDHFNRRILEFDKGDGNCFYIVSKDVYKKIKDKQPNIIRLRKLEEYADGVISVRAFGSTDEGVSFHVNIQDTDIFHAGDLNNWQWKDESTEAEVELNEKNFLDELKTISEHMKNCDIAMFPADPRLGADFLRGAKQFIDEIKPKCFIPMHFWDDYESVDKAKQLCASCGCGFIDPRAKN